MTQSCFFSNSVAQFNSKPPEVRGSTQAVLHDNNDTACTTILTPRAKHRQFIYLYILFFLEGVEGEKKMCRTMTGFATVADPLR
jgi:hypothetical protein